MRSARYPAALPQASVAWTVVLGVMVLGGNVQCRRAPDVTSAPPTATVTGRVLGSEGAPVAGATVDLTLDPDDRRVPVASAKTNTSGSFRMERVPPGGYRIRARAAGHVDGTAHVNAVAIPDGGARDRVELRLISTVVLAGRIQDGHGTPVPLARVLAFAVAEASSPVLHEALADDRGAFRLKGLGPGAHRLLIEAPGLGTASAGPVVAPDESVLVILPGEIRAIVGRVTRAGDAVRGAHVLLGGESVPEPRKAETDPEGRFAFAGLGPGSYFLRAEAGGLVAPVSTQAIDNTPSPARKIEIALVPGTFAHGRVVGEQSQAIEGASVQIDLVPATGLWPAVSTDANGNWTSAPLAPGTYRVRARRSGFLARGTATIEVGRGDPSGPNMLAPVKLELVRTGEISGRVIDERGRPLAGATVHDRLAETEELGVIWSRLPLAAEAAALPSGTVLPSAPAGAGGSRRTTTDAAGRFLLADVPPGNVRVEVLIPSKVPLRTASVKLVPGARLDVGTLRVQGAIQATGRVLGADGRPVAGVRVVATRLSSAPLDASVGLYAVTDGDGMFSLPLSTGEHKVTASAQGHVDAIATVRVQGAGTPPPAVTLRFAKGGNLVVEGVVRDAEMRPLARARIDVYSVADVRGVGDADPRAMATALTDAGGAFRLTGLSAGARLRLDVHHDDYAPYRQLIDDPGAMASLGHPVRVQVPLPGGIDGEVHERITGAPIPGFRIDARGPDGALLHFPEALKTRRVSGPLRFSLRRLSPGPWTLSVRARGYRGIERSISVGSATSLGDASVRDLRIELDRS